MNIKKKNIDKVHKITIKYAKIIIL